MSPKVFIFFTGMSCSLQDQRRIAEEVEPGETVVCAVGAVDGDAVQRHRRAGGDANLVVTGKGTFGRTYPAKSIYDYSFSLGPALLHFSEEITDEGLRTTFRSTAIQKYINGFAIHLLRTSKKERKRFYGLIRERKEEVKPWKQYLNLINRIMLIPLLGPLVTDLMARVFLMKKKNGNKV